VHGGSALSLLIGPCQSNSAVGVSAAYRNQPGRAPARRPSSSMAWIEQRRVDRRHDTIIRLGSLLIGRGLKWGFFAYLAYQARETLVALRAEIHLQVL
jgi:hypothetical protein